MQVNINGVSITLTQDPLDEIAAQTKPKKFEFNYSDVLYELTSTSSIKPQLKSISTKQINHGNCRQTEQAAKKLIHLLNTKTVIL